jgi:class 3 adenylate cyclase
LSRGVKISVYLLFFLLIAAIAYVVLGPYIDSAAQGAVNSLAEGRWALRAEDALWALGLLAGDLVLSYIFYYAVCYRNKKTFPIFVRTLLLLALVMIVSVAAICRAGAAYRRAAQGVPEERAVAPMLYVSFGAAAVTSLAVIASIVGNAKKILRTVDEMAANKRYVPSKVATGDELHALSLAVNAMAEDMAEHREGSHRRRDAYMRFIPEHFLALMGGESIEEINRETTASLNMTVVSVRFHIAAQLGGKDGPDEVFRRINAVTGRVTRLVGESGGTMFHFTHDGFEAVFDSAISAVSVSVAMRQTMLSELNYGALRIGIDSGMVMLGLVGDEHRITPTIVSGALSGAQKLADAARLLEAGILCTEAVANETEGYSIRYIGKCGGYGSRARACEVFDGDEYDLRKEKKRLQRDFNEALLTFYAGRYPQAKRMFLNIVRQCPGDGANRYYLYQSDKFEMEPPDSEFAIV